MTFPAIGKLAPAFTLQNQAGENVSLKDFKGKKNVVIYFYPKASTLGISPDNPKKLQKFIDKYDLNFDLLADEDHAVAEKYGVWGLKKFMGREFMGILRTSFFVDKNGCLRYIMNKVNTKTHDQEVIAYIKEHF